jgi:PKD repeat protein
MVALAGCSLDKQAGPPVSGPSELGLSLAITATPDVISQDGQSRSTIDVWARDASGQPWRGTLRAQTVVGGVEVDHGTLSAKVVPTNADGKAAFFYQAPAEPPPTAGNDTLVTIAITPVGSNYAGALARTVEVRLARPSVIVDPGAGPKASFFFSPNAPRFEDDVFFDASASTGQIVSYQWTFGDGRTDSSSGPTTRHHYGLPGTYNVVLTVVDDKGRASSTAPVPVTVGTFAAPTAAFTFSPTPVKVGAVVNFNASGSRPDLGRTIVSYIWDFGDGTFAETSGPTVQKAYGAVGSHVVVLKVTDDGGRTATTSQSLSVTP